MSFLEAADIDYLEPTIENVVLMMKSLDIECVSLSEAKKNSRSDFTKDGSTGSFDIYSYEGKRVFLRDRKEVRVQPKSTKWLSEESEEEEEEKDPRFREPRDSEVSTMFRYLKPKVEKQIKENLIRDHLNQFKNQQD